MNNIEDRRAVDSKYSPKMSVLKRVNKTSVKVGDIFKYTIDITNIGDIEIMNISVTDILPNVFVIKEIKLNGINISGDISLGLDIGNLQVGEIKTIVLAIKIISDLTNKFNNVVIVDGEAIVDKETGETISINESAFEPIGINVYNPKLTLIKSVDNDYAVMGDVITYKISIINSSDIDVTNVTIYDILSPELEFLVGSIMINGVVNTEEVITSGVNIGDISIGQNKEILYKAKIIGNGLKEIENISTANYDFKLDESIIQSGSVNSNIAVIYVEEANITVIKSVDKEIVSLGDILNYKVELINNGGLDAFNVIFKDELPDALEIINGTFEVNGNIVNSVNLEKGVTIGDIPIRTTTIVRYKAKVVAGTCTGNIVNKARISFKYILPDGIISSKDTVPNSDSTTIVAINLTTFKQISIDEYLSISNEKPEMESINNIEATIDILSSHIICTPKDRSYELQNLTGFKLIVHGILNQVVEYTALDPDQSVHVATYTVPFSSFIILPNTFVLGSKVEVEGIVEDVYYKENNCRSFFKNVTVLLVAKIVSCNK